MNYDICFKESCTGCSACFNVCPEHAITMQVDKKYNNFYYPVIDKSKCTQCKKCIRVCPNNNKLVKLVGREPEFCFAMQAKDDKVRLHSTSGGFAHIASKYAIEHGWFVCGAAFDDKLQLKHIIIDKVDNLHILDKSKYIESYIGETFSKISSLLEDNKKVLFIGTPCQVAGLKTLTKNHANLITIDLLCHGVPSQDLFNRYLKEEYDCDVKNFVFRYKPNFWSPPTPSGGNKVYAVNGYGNKVYAVNEDDPYTMSVITTPLSLRECCINCHFANKNRVGDITIGDFWGATADINDNKGTSIIFVNSSKGSDLIHKLTIDSQIELKKKNIIKSYLRGGFNRKAKLFFSREIFFKSLKNNSLHESTKMSINRCKNSALIFPTLDITSYGSVLSVYALYTFLKGRVPHLNVYNIDLFKQDRLSCATNFCFKSFFDTKVKYKHDFIASKTKTSDIYKVICTYDSKAYMYFPIPAGPIAGSTPFSSFIDNDLVELANNVDLHLLNFSSQNEYTETSKFCTRTILKKATITARDSKTQNKLSTLSDDKIHILLDPLFLLDAKDLCQALDIDKKLLIYRNDLSERLSYKIDTFIYGTRIGFMANIYPFLENNQESLNVTRLINTTDPENPCPLLINEFVSEILKAELVITDCSYTAYLCIIFKKRFALVSHGFAFEIFKELNDELNLKHSMHNCFDTINFKEILSDNNYLLAINTLQGKIDFLKEVIADNDSCQTVHK